MEFVQYLLPGCYTRDCHILHTHSWQKVDSFQTVMNVIISLVYLAYFIPDNADLRTLGSHYCHSFWGRALIFAQSQHPLPHWWLLQNSASFFSFEASLVQSSPPGKCITLSACAMYYHYLFLFRLRKRKIPPPDSFALLKAVTEMFRMGVSLTLIRCWNR
jgi:hypothetical protein